MLATERPMTNEGSSVTTCFFVEHPHPRVFGERRCLLRFLPSVTHSSQNLWSRGTRETGAGVGCVLSTTCGQFEGSLANGTSRSSGSELQCASESSARNQCVFCTCTLKSCVSLSAVCSGFWLFDQEEAMERLQTSAGGTCRRGRSASRHFTC